MSIKRIFIVMTAIFAASAVFADNSSVTSKKYVDDLMSGYQGKLPGSGANTLMIYDDETGIGEKSIETTLVSNATGVPTVGAVKTGLDGKQDTITGTAGYVMTGTGTPGEVGERAIYSANTNYSNALVTAETVNTGVINAVNNSLIRVGTDGQPNENGTLWEINTSLLALSALGYLPDDYTKLEYIESTGTQYIDTGFSPDENTRVDWKGSLTRYVSSTPLMGCRVSSDNSGRVFPFAWYSGAGTGRTTFGAIDATFPISTSTIYTGSFRPTDGISIINDTTYDISNAQFKKTQQNNFYLFATSGYPGTVYNSYGRIWYVKIYDNGTQVRDFIPAKNSSGVVGMYDTVSGQFFTNSGTGTFTAGPSCISPNLFDISQPSTTQTILNGIWRKYNVPLTLPDGDWTSKYMPNISAGTYTLSANSPWFSIVFFDGENATIITTSTTQATFTLPSAGEVWIFCATPSAMELITEAQLELGSTATTYRPYGENICD